ncbi:MAG: hypothetical protein PVG07_16520 [Acidobacteriota bacterium]|jgi:hypothetical protein
MSTRTVRLDGEDERILQELVRKTELPVSEILRRGFRALERETTETASRKPFDVYEELDPGPGGYASGPARGAAARPEKPS